VEKNKMVQVLVPALAAAGVVVLIGVLVAMSDWGAAAKSTAKGKQTSSGSDDDAGMSDAIPPLDAPDWKTLPSGIRTWDVKEGEGDPCPPGATVTIHYTGWLTDGTVFDNSRDKGAPTTFGLGSLISGWQEGIPGMKPGGIRRLEIPYKYAYGESGRPPKIPPKATLVFEIKLLSWK
jgi:FKBP-type peptidyl-prolyl cis-trans isomerase